MLIQLWGNGSIRILTGFLTLFVAFVVKAHTETDPRRQLLLLGIVGAAAGTGSFLGNGVGSRRQFGHPVSVVLSLHRGRGGRRRCWPRCCPGSPPPPSSGWSAATASALAKVCLDAVIQRDLPEESRASAFGRSETVLQLSWVFGGALGVLLPHENYWLGLHRGRRGGGAGRRCRPGCSAAAAACCRSWRRRRPGGPGGARGSVG